MSKLEPLIELCRSLQKLQTEAKALGVFVNDRELIDCPNCELFEDVTCEGLLITSRELANPAIDTGLRFKEISPDTYQCPACAQLIELKPADDSQG